jgi:hypothetical protein
MHKSKIFIKGKTYNDLVVVEAAMMANLRRALSEARSMNNSPNFLNGNHQWEMQRTTKEIKST